MWSIKICNLLLYWRDVHKYQFSFIADLIRREFGVPCSKSAAIAKYARLKNNGVKLDRSYVRDYL
jgi:hypothetical protein